MNLCRFQTRTGETRIGSVTGDTVLDLTAVGVPSMEHILEADDLAAELKRLANNGAPRLALNDVKFSAPVERQEVWAVGVTYLRSKTARMEESTFSATAYDRVYDAPRPELFFKSLPEKVVGPADAVGIRNDGRWNVPEPELALVLNSKGRIVGFTVGNDMTSRDIEGENLLYLPQAKIFTGGCALGPWIALGDSEAKAREWGIRLEVKRAGQVAFSGETSVSRIKRSFTELAEWLFRCQQFPHGAILLTGTGIVPPEDFTLQRDDVIRIEISGIGVLENPVTVV